MEIGTFWTFRIERLLRAWFFPSRTNWTKTRYLIGEGNEISARLSPCFRFTPFRNAKIRLCQVGTKIETCATKRFRNWSIREQRATVNRRPRNRKEYRGIREIASTIVMGFIWPSSIIGILPLAPESVSSNSFPIHRWILRMKFLLERIFLRLFEFLFFSSSSSSSSFFYFRRNPSLDIEPTTYVFFTVALHANNIWWISVPCSRIQFFNLDRIEFAFLLKSCCWIPS